MTHPEQPNGNEKKWTYKQVPYKSTYKVYNPSGDCYIDVRTETEAELITSKFNELDRLKAERFNMPTDGQVIEMALIFNDGKVDEALTNIVSTSLMIVDRLYQNGDIMQPTKKELEDGKQE